MLPLNRPRPSLLSVLSIVALFAAACEKVPLLAPTGSTITLTAATSALSANGTTQIIAQVLEAAGTPPHSGTHITFTTTLGRVEPSDATTDINGKAVVTYIAGTNNGNAVITAFSGGASTGTAGALRIAVGTAAVGRVFVDARPATVPALGGSTTITANVLDVNGNPLTSTPVSFTTTAGNLSANVAFTDATGIASVVLTTSQQATVTASVGAQAPASTTPTPTTPTTPTTPSPASSGTASGTVTVTVSAAPTIVIAPPSTPPSKGLPASFTFTVTASTTSGSAVRGVVVNWGDGTTQNLGAVNGAATVSHVFGNDGSYTVSATVTDAAGNTSTVSTGVTVIPVPRPTVIVTPTPQTQVKGGRVNFSIQITTPSGVGVKSTTIDFGDGTTQALGGATSANVPHNYKEAKTSILVTVTVVDTTNETTEGTTTVSITDS
jgi:PKD domain-containing protein/Big-like domain-containing protein